MSETRYLVTLPAFWEALGMGEDEAQRIARATNGAVYAVTRVSPTLAFFPTVSFETRAFGKCRALYLNDGTYLVESLKENVLSTRGYDSWASIVANCEITSDETADALRSLRERTRVWGEAYAV